MDSDKLIIGYSGSLSCYDPDVPGGNKLFSFRNYTVNHPYTRSAYFLFRGLQCFAQKYPALREKIVFNAWGMIEPGNISLAKKMGIAHMVSIEGFLPKPESLQRLSCSHVFFLPLETGMNGHTPYALPGKMYEYIQLGKPVLALCSESECAHILRMSGVGVITDPFNEEKIADTLYQLYSDMDRLSERYQLNTGFIEENFNASKLTQKLVKVFNELIQT